MKKWFAVLLAAMLVCVAVGAWAEVVPTKLGKGGSKKEPSGSFFLQKLLTL